MKYIRTKDEIMTKKEYERTNVAIEEHNSKSSGFIKIKMAKLDIIAQANTIEELCDEIVVVENKSHNIPSYLEEAINRFMEKQCGELSKDYSIEIYGAIWTDKGLIYVAKMNERGELELL